MKVLMTTDAVGGVWRYSLDLARGFAAYGVEVVLAGMGPEPDAAQMKAVRELPSVSFYHRPYSLEWMENPWQEVLEAGVWLQEIHRKEEVRLVHLNGYVHAALGWNVPVVVVAHSCVYSWFYAVKGTVPSAEWGAYHELVKRGLQAADRVIAPTRTMLGQCEEWYGKVSSGQVIYNGTAWQPFTGGKEKLVFAMGRLWDEAKNVRLLLRAAPSINGSICLAGPRPDLDEPVPDNVTLLGSLPGDEVQRWLRRAAIYALPVRYEPFGLSFLEAAVCGCALVGGDITSLREVWGSAMHYTDPEDAGQLAALCNRLLSDTPLQRRSAGAALKRSQRYTLGQTVLHYLTVYNELLTRNTGQCPRPESDSGQLVMPVKK